MLFNSLKSRYLPAFLCVEILIPKAKRIYSVNRILTPPLLVELGKDVEMYGVLIV